MNLHNNFYNATRIVKEIKNSSISQTYDSKN